MKKLILGVALASLVISCKKIQAGSNHGVLKMEEGADRYTEDHMHGEPMGTKVSAEKSATDTAKATGLQVAPVIKDSAKIEEVTAQ